MPWRLYRNWGKKITRSEHHSSDLSGRRSGRERVTLTKLCCKGWRRRLVSRQGQRAVSHSSITTSFLTGWFCTML